MSNAAKIAIVLISLIAAGFSAVVTASEVVFADKKAAKKNQNIDNKVECQIDIDHNQNSDVGSNNQLCDNDSISLIDSTLVQSSPDNGDGDNFTSPTVLNVDPNDNENDVSLNTEIKVVFSERMNQDTLDDGSLDIFNLDGSVDPNVNADPSSESVTYTLDRQLEPGTRYEAQLDFNIQDEAGNFLDCTRSNDVDSSCTWQFETTGSSNANIELDPTSGPIGTSVHISGTGFDPNSDVIITFGIFRAASSTNNNGEFSDNFDVPISTAGPLTVTASDGLNSDSATFTVTTSTNPVISINPDSGSVGTQVNITGINFDPNSDVIITFGGTAVTTIPSPVTTGTFGEFSANFTVPDKVPAQYTVEATDEGDNSDSTLFDVTVPTTPLSTNQQMDTNPSNTDNGESFATQGILPF